MNPALLPMVVQSSRSGGKALLLLFGLALLAGAAAFAGYKSRDSQVSKLEAERNASFVYANAQAQTLLTIKTTLREERERRNRVELAAQQELAARADRIAQLAAATEKRRQTITAEVSKDEDCNALRRLPVCAALADGLWGESPAFRPY